MTEAFRSQSIATLSGRSLPELATAAWKAVKEASTFDERKELAAKFDAVLAYQRRARASKEAMNTIAEIRLWNERYMGGMLSGIDLKPGRPSKKEMVDVHDHFSLAQIGVTKDQSSRYQALFGIPEDAFKATIADHQDGWGDWFFYGHADKDGSSIALWMLIDLNALRAALIRYPEIVTGMRLSGLKANGDGTHFRWFKVQLLPPSVLISSSHELRVAA